MAVVYALLQNKFIFLLTEPKVYDEDSKKINVENFIYEIFYFEIESFIHSAKMNANDI